MQEELPETFSEKHPLFIKIFGIIIGLFLLSLILVYFLLTPQIRSILSGLIESSKINNFEVELKAGNKLIFINETYEELTEIYNQNPELEFKVCLKGYIEKDYFITEIFRPKMYLMLFNYAIASSWKISSIVILNKRATLKARLFFNDVLLSTQHQMNSRPRQLEHISFSSVVTFFPTLATYYSRIWHRPKCKPYTQTS